MERKWTLHSDDYVVNIKLRLTAFILLSGEFCYKNIIRYGFLPAEIISHEVHMWNIKYRLCSSWIPGGSAYSYTKQQAGCPWEPPQRQNRKQPDHCGPKRIFFNVSPNYWDLMKSICIHILGGGSLIPGYKWAKKCHYADTNLCKTLANKQIIALLMSAGLCKFSTAYAQFNEKYALQIQQLCLLAKNRPVLTPPVLLPVPITRSIPGNLTFFVLSLAYEST